MGTSVDSQGETQEIPARLREEVRERDGGLCRVCGAWGESLAIHHLVYRSQGGQHEAANLISVHWMYAPRCHEQMHGENGCESRRMRELGLLVAQTPGLTVLQAMRWEDVSRAPSMDETVALFWAKVDRRGPDECWEWQASLNAHGYGQLSAKAIKPVPIRAPSMSFFLANGRWPFPACLHHCDNRKCVNPQHLYEGTQADNMRDRVERRPRHGAANPAAKHASKVDEIRRRVTEGESQSDVARSLGVSQSIVSRIARGVNYPAQAGGLARPR